MELTIVDQGGWKKPVKLVRSVTRIGSASSNDIQIDSPAISPFQLQVIYANETPSACRVLNLGMPLTVRTNTGERAVAAYESVDVSDGDELLLDTYRIVFRMPVSSGVLSSSAHIAVNLQMDEAVLRPHVAAVGRLVITNTGTRPASQFQVTVSGLPPECFRIDPIPLLYPGAQEEVRIQFLHRVHTPPAGVLQVTLAVSASAGYPGEQVVLRQGLFVMPVVTHQLVLQDDMPVSPQEAPPVLFEAEPIALAAAPTATPPEILPVPEPEPVAEPALPVREPEPVKVIKGVVPSYWDDEK